MLFIIPTDPELKYPHPDPPNEYLLHPQSNAIAHAAQEMHPLTWETMLPAHQPPCHHPTGRGAFPDRTKHELPLRSFYLKYSNQVILNNS